jgi:hypothetical protein
MEFLRLSTQRIMCIFSLIKNFLRYAQILPRQLLHKTSTHLLQVLHGFSFVSHGKKKRLKKFQTFQLNCFPYIAGKVKRSYGVTRFGVHLKRNISEWSTTVCTTSRRIRRDGSSNLYYDIQKLGDSFELASNS